MKNFSKLIQAQFDVMCATGKLFRSSISGNDLWDLYLSSFINDPVFRDPKSSSHNCNNCKNFIRRYGNIVAIIDNKVVSMFDVAATGEYVNTAKVLSEALTKASVAEVFVETFLELNKLPYEKCTIKNSVFRLGIDKNYKTYSLSEAALYGVVKEGETVWFSHLFLDIPKQYIDVTGQSAESIMAVYRTDKEVFKRAMDGIPLDVYLLISDLIKQNSLLNGTTYLPKIELMMSYKEAYDKLTSEQEKDNWCWVTSHKNFISKFRNEVIGTLCVDLSEGIDLNVACQAWNKKVDPVNFMKCTAPITAKQKEEAKKFVEENGYTESFSRRFATIEDIKISEIKHINSSKPSVKTVSIFDSVQVTPSNKQVNKYDGVEEVTIDKFLSDVLPTCESVELLLKNNHKGNLVSLTTANNPDSKPIFKWNNNYSWTFNGNLAGKSQIQEVVKSAGGNIDGVLMVRLVWNHDLSNDSSDLDLWLTQPDRIKIGFSSGYRKDSGGKFSSLSGQLDLDDQGSRSGVHAENIYFKDKSKMIPGVYEIYVNQYRARNSKGFKAEIEFDGCIYSYEYNKPVSSNVKVANVTLDKSGNFTITHLLPCVGGEMTTIDLYGLETNKFHKVNLVCLSPNHWDDNNVGNKHYMFMLDGCKADSSIRSFHNENLNSELLQHKRVIDALGASNFIESTDNQLSGLGFNSTVKDEVIAKLTGSFNRVIKIKF